jgi:hypothetical protein
MSFFTRHFSIKGMPRKFFRFKTAHIFPRSRIFPFSHDRKLFACWETKAIIDHSKCETCPKYSVWDEGVRKRCLYEYEMLKSAGYYDEAGQAEAEHAQAGQPSASSERSAEQEKAEREKAEREIEELKKANEEFERELKAEREELAKLALLLESRSSRSKSSLFEERAEQSGLEESESETEEIEEEEDSESYEASAFDLPENFDGEESDDF